MVDGQGDFLRELAALSRKYRIRIDGCGCCSSPFLVHVAGEISGTYIVDQHGGNLELEEDEEEAQTAIEDRAAARATKPARILRCAAVMETMPEFDDQKKSTAWAIANLGGFTFEEFEAARRVLGLIGRIVDG